MDSMNSIYDIVSAKRKVPASKVKWSIRNTIKRLNRVAPKECLKDVFYIHSYNEEVTPKDFIPILILYEYIAFKDCPLNTLYSLSSKLLRSSAISL